MLESNFIASGKLLIHKYVPAALLKTDVDEMSIDEFIACLAQAEYLRKVERNTLAQAIADVLSDE